MPTTSPRDRSITNEAGRLARHLSASRVIGLEATLTLEEWLATLDLFNWACAYCGGPFEALEHLVPDYFGGGTTRENCFPSCRSCNRRKAGIDPRMGYMRAFGGDMRGEIPFHQPITYPLPEKPHRRHGRSGCSTGPSRELLAMLRNLQGSRTQAAYASWLGISEAMLSRIYSGERIPGPACLRKLIAVLPEVLPLAIKIVSNREE